MKPISYRMVGQYDQLFQVDIGADGSYLLQRGGYRSAAPRRGSLSAKLQRDINRLTQTLEVSLPPLAPEGVDGFVSELVLNPGRGAEVIRWWGPLTDAASPLARLVGLFRNLS